MQSCKPEEGWSGQSKYRLKMFSIDVVIRLAVVLDFLVYKITCLFVRRHLVILKDTTLQNLLFFIDNFRQKEIKAAKKEQC